MRAAAGIIVVIAPAPRHPSATPELPVLDPGSADAWERWLHDHHDSSRGVWLTIPKRGPGTPAPAPALTYAEALEAAICVGWIDGQKRAGDDRFWLQRFTPRGPRSKWSQVNRAKAQALIAAGRMQPAGLAQIQAAQRDGRWEAAYEPQSAATVPDDFQRALDADPAARDFFTTLTGARRYAFLYRLHHVRSPQARAKRIETYIEMLRDGRAYH